MNPLWCMVAGPVIAYTFSFLENRNINLSTATKVAFSFVLTAIARYKDDYDSTSFELATAGQRPLCKST